MRKRRYKFADPRDQLLAVLLSGVLPLCRAGFYRVKRTLRDSGSLYYAVEVARIHYLETGESGDFRDLLDLLKLDPPDLSASVKAALPDGQFWSQQQVRTLRASLFSSSFLVDRVRDAYRRLTPYQRTRRNWVRR